MKLNLQVWRQAGPDSAGRFENFAVDDLEPNMSLLELFDKLNEQLTDAGKDPVAFESDCREGICGSCGVTVNGRPHGPDHNTPSCHQRLRGFTDGSTLRVEPLRSGAFPVVRDLVVDRRALDRVIQAGGWVSVDAGTAPDADALPVDHDTVETPWTTPPASAAALRGSLPQWFGAPVPGSKMTHMAPLPMPKQERTRRGRNMVEQVGPSSARAATTGVLPGLPCRGAFSAVAAAEGALRSALQRKL